MIIKVMAVGDVCGRVGLDFLRRNLRRIQRQYAIDFTVVNGENANVVGVTPQQCEEIFDAGADVITLGNHTWTRTEIQDYLDHASACLRPANFAPQCPGRGVGVYDTRFGPICVVSLIGRFGLDANTDNPFVVADNIMADVDAKVILVDFHAEATSEKLALSFYLDGRLLKETDLSNAVAIAWNDFYMLCIEDRVYILDVQQKDRSGVTRGSEYQYEAYYWTNVPARVWYKDDEHLYFGAENGVIYRFFTEKMSSFSYNDNGAAIAARWDFMHKGRNFHKNKTMTRLSANLAATPNSSLSVFYRRSTDFAYTEAALDARISYFMYSALRYSGFVYGGNSEAKTISKKLKIKKYDSCVISLRNEKPDEGIVLYALTLEFNEGNPYKLDY